MENKRSFFFDEDNNPKPNPFVTKEGSVKPGKQAHWVSFIRMQNLYKENTLQEIIDQKWESLKAKIDYSEKHPISQKAQ